MIARILVLLVFWSSAAVAETELCGTVFSSQKPFRIEEQWISLSEGVEGLPKLLNLGGNRQRSLAIVAADRIVIASFVSGAVVHRTLALPVMNISETVGGDFDGNGCEDLALIDSARRVFVAWSNCDTLAEVAAWIPELPAGEVFPADLTGDGKVDLLVTRPTGVWRAFISDGRGAPRKQPWIVQFPIDQAVTRWLADLNFDGRADLNILSPDGTLTLGASDGVTGFVGQGTTRADFDHTRRFDRFFKGDFVGGGSSELIGRDTNHNSLCLLRPGFIAMTQCPMAQFLGETPWADVAVGDFDGDDSDELLVYRWKAKGWTRYRWRVDRGEEDRPLLPLPGEHTEVLVGDIDADGLDDLIFGEPLNHRWAFARSQFSVAAPGVTVRVRSGDSVVTDEKGRYCVKSQVTGEEQLQVPSNQRVYPPFRLVELAPTTKFRHGLSFVIDRDSEVDGPQLCVGLVEGSWGRQGRCPKGFAFYGLDDSRDTRSGPTSGPCCPLPAKDIEVGDPFSADLVCLESSIVIGWEKRCDNCGYSVLCRKINSERYQLGPETEGVYWGFGFTRWDESHFIPKMNLPPNLRHAVGRTSFAEWDIDGCVGLPLGSVLTGRPAGYCSGTRFRQLQYRGAAGDPAQGTPVKMLLECREVTDLFSAEVRCKR